MYSNRWCNECQIVFMHHNIYKALVQNENNNFRGEHIDDTICSFLKFHSFNPLSFDGKHMIFTLH